MKRVPRHVRAAVYNATVRDAVSEVPVDMTNELGSTEKEKIFEWD